jgi:transcriptional regulator with XRE-family HTH domain
MQLPRLKEWREARGFTQRTLAAEAHTGYVTIYKIEDGNSCTPTTAKKLADALQVDIRDLMEYPPVPLDIAREWDQYRREMEHASEVVESLKRSSAKWNLTEQEARILTGKVRRELYPPDKPYVEGYVKAKDGSEAEPDLKKIEEILSKWREAGEGNNQASESEAEAKGA